MKCLIPSKYCQHSSWGEEYLREMHECTGIYLFPGDIYIAQTSAQVHLMLLSVKEEKWDWNTGCTMHFLLPELPGMAPKALKVTGTESSCPTAASERHRATKAGTRMRLTASPDLITVLFFLLYEKSLQKGSGTICQKYVFFFFTKAELPWLPWDICLSKQWGKPKSGFNCPWLAVSGFSQLIPPQLLNIPMLPFPVNFSVCLFPLNFPCSKESRSSIQNWVRDSSTDPSTELQLLFLSIHLALSSWGRGKRLPWTCLQETSTCACHLASFLVHSRAKAVPSAGDAPAGISCVCLGEDREGGRGRAGLVVMQEASQNAAFIRGTCWVINSQQRQTGEIFVPVWRARATGEIRKHRDGSNLASFHQYTLLY